jgi:hypothetical protein
MLRILCQIIGGAFSLVGLMGLVLPIPFGLIIGMAFLVIGLLFLIPTTPMVTRWVRKARMKANWFDRGMSNMTNRLPATYRRIFKQTEIDAFDW